MKAAPLVLGILIALSVSRRRRRARARATASVAQRSDDRMVREDRIPAPQRGRARAPRTIRDSRTEDRAGSAA
ncbi:MAG: hypothetical protein MZW92_49990 [Comamonadaceae bacterium]|nr:hypothetical protein [Comamonadaceae bacterium]